jgi:hypothetical protein
LNLLDSQPANQPASQPANLKGHLVGLLAVSQAEAGLQVAGEELFVLDRGK